MKINPLSIKTILMLTISMLTMLIVALVIRETYVEGRRMLNIRSLQNATYASDQLFEVIDKLTSLRDLTYSTVYISDLEVIKDIMPEIMQRRHEADKALESALAAMRLYDFFPLKDKLEETRNKLVKIQALRKKLDKEISLPLSKRNNEVIETWFKEITDLTLQTQLVWVEFIKNFYDVDTTVTLHMGFKYVLSLIMELSGRERSLISRLIIENKEPTAEEQVRLIKLQGSIETEWGRIGTISYQSGLNAIVDPYIKDAKSHYTTIYEMTKDMFYVPGVKHVGTYPISAQLWIGMSSQTTDSLYELKNATLKETRIFIDRLESLAERVIIFHIIVLLLSLCICSYSFWVVISLVINPINEIINGLMDATKGKKVLMNLPYISRNDEIGKLTRVLYAFQENVEEIKKTSEMLVSYTKDLERSNKELDDFAYIASHDLKEPLRGIHNHSRFLLEDNRDKMDPESVNRLNRLMYLSKRMEVLINDLLYFSRLGRQEMVMQETDISEVIHDVENSLNVMIKENHAKLIISESLPVIKCDKLRVTEVFRNLISNAIKYNNKEDKIVEIGFLNECRSSYSEIIKNVFYVKDNGVGIATEFHGEIFRIFKKLQESREGEGTGAGLTFVKKIVERHGGRIWLESSIGNGTTFYFTLEKSALPHY